MKILCQSISIPLLATAIALSACSSEREDKTAAGVDIGKEETRAEDKPQVDAETQPADDQSTGKEQILGEEFGADTGKVANSGTSTHSTQAYFGDTHVHTGWSADAGMDGATLTPEDAYRFATGEEVTSNSGLKAKLKRPYDWFMITDHSDGMGVINEIVDANPEMMANETLKRWHDALTSGDEKAASDAKSELVVLQSEGKLPKEVMDPKWMKSAWEKTVDAAEKFYQPGEFSTFIAYEWTVNAGGGDNLHRNVIFRDDASKTRNLLPLTTFETQDPERLWAWMKAYEDKTGGRVLAIPHNGNMSNGRMFEEKRFDGSPMTKEWAEMRARYEPLYELTQIKGQSESHPSLSPEDEFADWDLWDRGNLILKPKPPGSFKYEYWRPALKAGMRLEEQLGTNPFQYGANAGTDNHVGLTTPIEDNFFGKFKSLEPSNKTRWEYPILTGPTGAYVGWEQAASGLTGVWATENTREAIWDAMMRKETFATTGPRMTVRFFGGFDFEPADAEGDLEAAGYEKGVPMGGKLKGAKPAQRVKFLVAAMKDPEGANLDRVQIIKGWLDGNGEAHEKVYNVKWSGDRKLDGQGHIQHVGDTVDLKTAEYDKNAGDAQLIGYFEDKEFNPSHKAVYYVRVLEVPTPRWTLYDKVRNKIEMDKKVPLTLQERAFSSPIWYSPD
ncbi:DUF3604 domain-containing protein [uncultured Microbulbifer sp.]|uniref:DUF3604 domain-containing protein n=1 Tax=uncultured Microbulbifer sp. TaxID=348147 RepID=UPI0025E02BF2|nr:DUF3604 domain-containing protein [uncultured Microbulbifer sp.]